MLRRNEENLEKKLEILCKHINEIFQPINKQFESGNYDQMRSIITMLLKSPCKNLIISNREDLKKMNEAIGEINDIKTKINNIKAAIQTCKNFESSSYTPVQYEVEQIAIDGKQKNECNKLIKLEEYYYCYTNNGSVNRMADSDVYFYTLDSNKEFKYKFVIHIPNNENVKVSGNRSKLIKSLNDIILSKESTDVSKKQIGNMIWKQILSEKLNEHKTFEAYNDDDAYYFNSELHILKEKARKIFDSKSPHIEISFDAKKFFYMISKEFANTDTLSKTSGEQLLEKTFNCFNGKNCYYEQKNILSEIALRFPDDFVDNNDYMGNE